MALPRTATKCAWVAFQQRTERERVAWGGVSPCSDVFQTLCPLCTGPVERTARYQRSFVLSPIAIEDPVAFPAFLDPAFHDRATPHLPAPRGLGHISRAARCARGNGPRRSHDIGKRTIRVTISIITPPPTAPAAA